MNLLCGLSVVSVTAALGHASQTAFAAAFRKLIGETPNDWRRRARSSNRSTGTAIALAQRQIRFGKGATW
jgi:AraC-like DNA-binding protein